MIRAAALALAMAAVVPAARADVTIVPVTSPDGIEAWLHEDHSIPILTIAAGFLGGAGLDPEGREGAAALMAPLLLEGAGPLDSTAFGVALEELALRTNAYASDDAVVVSATMLAETRETSVELLRTALTEPRFDPEPVERLRGQVVASIRARESDPGTLAGLAIYADAFPDHSYGRPIEGTAASVAAIGVDDLRRVHAMALTRDHMRVTVVGAIRPEEVGPMLDRLFGDLPDTGGALPPDVAPSLSGGTTVIDLDSPQSVVVVGTAGISDDDPDFIPAMVMDYILGGGINSRLMEELREKRSLTYGVSTSIASAKLAGLYLGWFSSSNESVAEALAVLRAEWARMADDGVTEADLASAKRFLTGDYALRFDGNASIAGQLLGMQIVALGRDYVSTRNAQVEAVTAADVARVARRLLASEPLTTVVVGRPEGIAPNR